MSYFAPVSKRVYVQNLSYENDFDLHENEPVGGSHFHMNCFACRLVLTQRQKTIRKWPIEGSLFGYIINILLTEFGQSVCANLGHGHEYRPHCRLYSLPRSNSLTQTSNWVNTK